MTHLPSIQRLRGLLSLLVLLSSPNVAFGLTPPAFNELCRVVGAVKKLGSAEASSPIMDKRFTVPTVTVKLSEAKLSGVKEPTGLNCKKLKVGQELILRNCDNYQFTIGSKITGIAGRVKGGGPFCITSVEEKGRGGG